MIASGPVKEGGPLDPQRCSTLLHGVEAVTFDLDGTLVDTGPLLLRSWPRLLVHPRILLAHGRAVDELRHERVLDAELELARRVGLRVGGSPDRIREVLHDELDIRWPSVFRFGGVRPEVAALIKAVDVRGLPRAVVSDFPALDKLRALDLDGWSCVVDCRALGAFKPQPDGLFAAAAQLGVTPGRLLHIGDRDDTDGAAAAAAGARYLHIRSLSA
jgi:FMN phosphatase YigB (HAD superfamily)